MPASDRISWAYIRRLAMQHKRSLVLANLLAILAALCSVPIPLLLPLLVDAVLLEQGGRSLELMNALLPDAWQQAIGYIGFILALSLILRVAGLVFNVGQSKMFTHLSKDVVYRVREHLLLRLQRISLQEYESLGSGTVTTHLVTDLDTLDQFIGETLSRFLVSILILTGTASVLLWMHWKLALLILLLNPVVVFCTIKLGKRVKHLKKLENDSTAVFTQSLNETLDAIQEVRAGNHQGFFFQRLIQHARHVRDRAISSHWKTDVAQRASALLFQYGIDIFRAVAMLTVLFSDLSIGQMLAVFSYLWFMISPIEQLLSMQYAFYAADGAMVRINQLLAREDEVDYPATQNPFVGRKTLPVSVEHLTFSYGSERVLDDLSFSVAAGEKVAIVGSSGGGKSTLVQLLLGLYPAQSGLIRYGNATLQEIGLSCVREHVAVVLQTPALFNDSLRANLSMGRQVDDAQCWQALAVAQLADMVHALPKKLDTVIGRAGVRLSGGQRQRLAIARMVLSDPKVVILDEATSALDSATEYAVHEALNEFLAGRTTFIIAHRLSAVKQADRILVLSEGRVVESGEHHKLLAQGGLYAQLYGALQR
ncbi:ABC transporter ATP-binding protein [Denitrificimonas sp. JX-1]|uniref:ABC transporter ATP-binding protein n=1 Tax=Denitrificimonas halotolerans TaxID=3098930 RepID=A0ABU5GP03_9GAMM|nr:ABC transporter ATP-binding protein [Denitrificimonas sp. JX-1]MDY7218681.1 ABC transporter ATP-binding protein [Denitrificimonas sp. JX-1]